MPGKFTVLIGDRELPVSAFTVRDACPRGSISGEMVVSISKPMLTQIPGYEVCHHPLLALPGAEEESGNPSLDARVLYFIRETEQVYAELRIEGFRVTGWCNKATMDERILMDVAQPVVTWCGWGWRWVPGRVT